MGELKSHVPALIEKKGWNIKTFVGYCMLAGLSERTAYRLAQGDTNVTVDTIRIIAQVLGANSLSDIMDVNGDQ